MPKRKGLGRKGGKGGIRVGKKKFHANGREKKAGVVVLVSDKIDFKTKKLTRDKEGHYIVIKGSVQQEDITIIIYMHPIQEHQHT